MATVASEVRRCLETLDVAAMRKLWRHVAPHLPQPITDFGIVISMHHARTQAKSIPLKLRAYSHRWLLDHELPSGLPDELKPKAERLYPRIVDAVGVAVKASSPILAPVGHAIQNAMSDAVLDAYADGKRDPVFVKQRMFEARDRQRKYFRDLFEEAKRR